MSPNSLDVKELKAIIDWLNVTDDVREFSLKFGDVELFVSRNQHASIGQPSLQVSTSAPAPAAAPAAGADSAAPAAPPHPGTAISGAPPLAALAADEVLIKAPMVGTFYAAPKPGQPDFVAVGDAVNADAVLCIVEVMKLMNNIEAGVAGTVARILVQNEQAVEYGQPLMVIRRSK